MALPRGWSVIEHSPKNAGQETGYREATDGRPEKGDGIHAMTQRSIELDNTVMDKNS